MTVRANIALSDGEATPVVHTFVPDGDVSPGSPEAVYVNRNAVNPAASERVYLTVKRSPASPENLSLYGKKVEPRRVIMRLKYPATYVDATTGQTMVDFEDELIIETKSHPRSSEQRSKNLRVMGHNMLSGTSSSNQLNYAIDKGEHVWG